MHTETEEDVAPLGLATAPAASPTIRQRRRSVLQLPQPSSPALEPPVSRRGSALMAEALRRGGLWPAPEAAEGVGLEGPAPSEAEAAPRGA